MPTVVTGNGKAHLFFSLLTQSGSFAPQWKTSCFAQPFEMQTFCIFLPSAQGFSLLTLGFGCGNETKHRMH